MGLPPQGIGGGISLDDVINYLKEQGALNKEYDPNLAGLIPASKLDFSFGWELISKIGPTATYEIDFTKLSGDDDELYMLIIIAHNPSTADIRLGTVFKANGVWDNNAEDYAYIAWINNDGTVSTITKSLNTTTGLAATFFGYLPAGKTGVFCSIINAVGISNGTDTVVHILSKGYFDGPGYVNVGGAWLKQGNIEGFTVDNLTATGAVVKALLNVYLFKLKT